MILDSTCSNNLAFGGTCHWNIKRHDLGSVMEEAIHCTLHLRSHSSQQK